MPELVAVKGNTVITGHGCDTTTTTFQCSETVYIGGEGVCHNGDLLMLHNEPAGSNCVPHISTITAGSGTVFADGKAIARNKDAADAGNISSGNGANVYAG